MEEPIKDFDAKKDVEKPWYNFMASNQFAVFMNISRIATLLMVVVLIYIMASNIEEVKLLAGNVCDLCMQKTGAQCFVVNAP